jgi:hypothetical protein
MEIPLVTGLWKHIPTVQIRATETEIKYFLRGNPKLVRKIEEKSIEAKTSGICHGSRQVGRKTSSRKAVSCSNHYK